MTDQLYARSPDASASTVADRVVLYHRQTRAALVLNPTGTWIWRQMSAPVSAGALADALCARFPTLSPEAASRDVDAFLADLAAHTMVSVGT
jgi:hypothetical protein